MKFSARGNSGMGKNSGTWEQRDDHHASSIYTMCNTCAIQSALQRPEKVYTFSVTTSKDAEETEDVQQNGRNTVSEGKLGAMSSTTEDAFWLAFQTDGL
ncbi:hypothetical protein ACOMHN_034166 [Nucella lapillus]